MSPFTGRAIGLAFAGLWLLAGVVALAPPWSYGVGAAGIGAIAALGVRAWRLDEPRTGLFRMRRYRVAVVAEFVAIGLTQALLTKLGLLAYLLPVVGVLVGLHFIGLWWAGGGTRYLALAATMTFVDAAVLLLLPAGSAAMQAAAGLGSAATLAGFAGTGARR